MTNYPTTSMGEATGNSFWTPTAPKGGELVCSNDDFDIWQVRRSGGWFALKVIDKREGNRKKRSFRMGWNGERFAGGKELEALRKYRLEELVLAMLKTAGY